MSATDTKETPTPRVDAALKTAWVVGADIVSPDDARQIERDLTAVTAQRDRALGLLERAIQWVEDGAYAYGEEDSDQRCISCGAVAAHRKDCAIDKLLTEYTAEYEALRKGER